MRAAEKSLLIAVRDQLRAVCQYAGGQCNIEYDDQVAPATTGDLFVVVTTGGWVPGPRHGTCGGVDDFVYSVNVGVVRRIGHVPRDRRTDEVYLRNLSGLAAEVDKIVMAVDWKYQVIMERANPLILAETSSNYGFIHPLVFKNVTQTPEIVGGEVFGAEGKTAGLKRTVSFGAARRITVKS